MMRLLLSFFAWVLFPGTVYPQQFALRNEVMLDDSVVNVLHRMADMDNDGLPDVVMIVTSGDHRYLQIIKGDTTLTPVPALQAKRVLQEVSAFEMTDYNHDNQLDIILSGVDNGMPATVVMINNGHFKFTTHGIAIETFNNLLIADLDNDAREDWIVSGELQGNYFLKMMRQTDDYTWTILHDSVRMLASAISVVDYDENGLKDVFVSGLMKPDSVGSFLLMNHDNWYFTVDDVHGVAGAASAMDVNADGIADLALITRDQSLLLESRPGDYQVIQLPVSVSSGRPFLADFNSDGVSDLNYYGTTAGGSMINGNLLHREIDDPLPKQGLIAQHVADLDLDGDLDLIMLIQDNGFSIRYYENTIQPVNARPAAPAKANAVQVFDRALLYWERTTDDHTPAASITYDLHLEGSTTTLTSGFDLLNEQRLLTRVGNNGTSNFAVLRNTDTSTLEFAVQSIDNALHPGSICIGKSCTSTSYQSLSACSGEILHLQAPSQSLWFSFASGYLGKFQTLERRANKADTVFYYTPGENSCGTVHAFTIGISDSVTKVFNADEYYCENELAKFSVETGWEDIRWRSSNIGDLGSGTSITYQVTHPDSLIVTLRNQFGCTLIRKTALHVSSPSLTVTPDQLVMVKGGKVMPTVTGAQRYLWAPVAGVDNPSSNSPELTPDVSTSYTVTGYDSIGCEGMATLKVIVVESGFVPTLFTPNEDGKNDQLRLYGIGTASGFKFKIFNREGVPVYSTSNLADAVNSGWDGTRNGNKQPPGVYYWRVEGADAVGQTILLNGRQEGSFVLVR